MNPLVKEFVWVPISISASHMLEHDHDSCVCGFFSFFLIFRRSFSREKCLINLIFIGTPFIFSRSLSASSSHHFPHDIKWVCIQISFSTLFFSSITRVFMLLSLTCCSERWKIYCVAFFVMKLILTWSLMNLYIFLNLRKYMKRGIVWFFETATRDGKIRTCR